MYPRLKMRLSLPDLQGVLSFFSLSFLSSSFLNHFCISMFSTLLRITSVTKKLAGNVANAIGHRNSEFSFVVLTHHSHSKYET